MLDFSSWIDLPLIWGLLIATAVFMYVLLDGFDLGVGILFPFAPSDTCRDRMIHSIAPFWDGNETWLVLGGGGLFAAFPLAYSVLFPAFYIPLIVMLLGLVLRGIAFEFRFKAETPCARRFWDYVFHIGSLVATFFQGVVLGAFVSGVSVTGRDFSGGPFDWLSGFSVMTGLALVFGYVLLGATWLIMKTEDVTQRWARWVAGYALGFVGLFMVLVSVSVPMMSPRIRDFWFSTPNIYWLSVIPLLTLVVFLWLWGRLARPSADYLPFLLGIGVFFLGYLGLGLSLFPWIVPFHFNLWQAAASMSGLSILLIGIAIILPIILAYTGYCYYVFRGKASHEPMHY